MSAPAVYPQPRVRPAGDQAVLVEVGDGIDEHVNRTVHALALALERRQIGGVIDVIPTYRSLLVNYDPVRLPFEELTSAVSGIAASLDTIRLPAPRRIEIPTCYGGPYGPDLAFVAQHNGLAEDEVVAIHTSGTYRVFMMGFSPGFAYLGGMSPRIATPRLKTPRTSIPAGSVGIAQNQTGIYPVESPGGWQLIGRTPVRLFDPMRTPPTLVEPGDEIAFAKIDDRRYGELAAEMRPGLDSAFGPSKVQQKQGAPGQVVDESALKLVRDSFRGAAIEVLDGGVLTTIQDLGRYGFQRYGVPVSGAMDAFALRVGNLLVGNAENAAALEITLAGPQLLLLEDLVLAVTGGDLQPRLDEASAPMWQAVAAPKGSVLSFRGVRSGARAYLAIAGGVAAPLVLGSRSTYLRSRFGGFEGRTLQPGDRLSREGARDVVGTHQMPRSWLPTYLGSHRVRVVLGPQHDAFTARGIQTLLTSAYIVGQQSDRMGYRLEGPPIEHRGGADIVSDGTPAGAVQVSGDGQPLVLLADRGTTGGYAKIATVIGADLPRLAQCRPGDRVFFDAATLAEAHEAWRRQEALIDEIRNAPLVLGPSSLVPGASQGRATRDPGPHRLLVKAPLPGKIVEVVVHAGDAVARGQKLCVLEAMKMENPLSATRAGRVKGVHVAAGDQVTHGQLLIEIESVK